MRFNSAFKGLKLF